MHLVLEFNQPQWLRPYIEFNLQERMKAEKKRHRRKIVLQIYEQCYIQKSNGKFEKQN